jgi:hypothetical protein
MTDLEQALVALGRELELPPAPDIAASVRGRLEARPRRSRRLVAVVLLLLVALAVALAVPQARSAILRLFHIRGAEVSIVERLPPAAAPTAQLGRPGTLADVPFRVLLPQGRRPDAVYLAEGGVWLRYGPAAAPRLLVAEFRTGDPWFLKKVAVQGADVRYTSVGGHLGLWIAGPPHRLALPGGAARLAGNTLLWQRGTLTLRLEAGVTLERATELALAFR